MSAVEVIEPEFVEEIPEQLLPGKLYISIPYSTVVHLCCCGCGKETVTTLHPTRWKLTYDGETVSLNPSVGSWSMPCQSHYFITRNRVRWAARWSRSKIEAGRQRDAETTNRYFTDEVDEVDLDDDIPELPQGPLEKLRGWLGRG